MRGYVLKGNLDVIIPVVCATCSLKHHVLMQCSGVQAMGEEMFGILMGTGFNGFS